MFARSCGIGVVRLFRPSLIGGPASGATKKTVKAVVKATVPAAGKACLAIGAAAAGTNLDCVTVGKALQWQPRGSRVNPFHLNDGAEYVAYEGNRYRLKIASLTVLTPADIKPGGQGKYPIPTGMTPVRVDAELTYLGPKDSNNLPASITYLVFWLTPAAESSTPTPETINPVESVRSSANSHRTEPAT